MVIVRQKRRLSPPLLVDESKNRMLEQSTVSIVNYETCVCMKLVKKNEHTNKHSEIQAVISMSAKLYKIKMHA